MTAHHETLVIQFSRRLNPQSVLMINSSHNRESSALPYLSSAFGLSDEKDLNTLGIFTSETDRVKCC